jgi:hypothetical protein
MRCENKVTQYVLRGFGYKAVEMRCGSTSVHGDVLLCDECAWKAKRQYPQGWKNSPGDTCRHGTYLGCHEDNDERLCGRCEAGDES